MKRLAATAIGIILLGGCATADKPYPANTQAAGRGRASASAGVELARADAMAGKARASVSSAEGDGNHGARPDSIITIDPKSGRLSEEMTRRLREIADQIRQEDRIIVRLESYVPDGGSPALNLGRAYQTLQIVRDRLQGMGIPQRRIQLASFGEEYIEERDPHKHWVEIYLVRTGLASLPAAQGSPAQR